MKRRFVKGFIIWAIAKVQAEILSTVSNHFKQLRNFVFNKHDTSNKNFLRADLQSKQWEQVASGNERDIRNLNIGAVERRDLKMWKVSSRKFNGQERMVGGLWSLELCQKSSFLSWHLSLSAREQNGSTKCSCNHQSEYGGNDSKTSWVFPGERELYFFELTAHPCPLLENRI